jgi:hypothetical protein
VLFFLSVTIPFTSLASTHPCQYPEPPSVTNQLIEPSTDTGKLFINEVLLTPHANWNCSDTNDPSPVNDTWVEIYNSQDVAYNLENVGPGGAALDHGEGTDPFYFPVHSAIAPHSFLVVFPRTDANFFNSETSTLRLLISGKEVDKVTLPSPDLPMDTSYARIPDGSDNWQILNTPTIGASNPTLQTSISSTTAIATISHTPTPKPSPTPHHTPTPRPSKTSRSSSSKQDSSTTASGGAAQTGSDSFVLIDGTQPAWNRLPVPGSTPSSSTAIADTSNTSTNEPLATPDDDGGRNNTIRNIEMTVLAILLAGSLLWCWKLFISPVLSKQKK